MADIKLNFSSQWPTVQVAKVIASPDIAGEADTYPYLRKIKHNLGYPPLAIGMSAPNGGNTFNTMVGLDVDDTYVYIPDYASTSTQLLQCAVVYALDISKPFNYAQYASQVGDVLPDTSGGNLDLRKFLLHSRAVGPMVLAVATKTYTTSDLSFTYVSPLNYPTFQFGYVHLATTSGNLRAGLWKSAPLASQSFPWLNSDGYTSILGSTVTGGVLSADIGSIITLRNPAIITNNSVVVNI
jgi:hypothetical protein